jgi:hypothetical protein
MSPVDPHTNDQSIEHGYERERPVDGHRTWVDVFLLYFCVSMLSFSICFIVYECGVHIGTGIKHILAWWESAS